MIVFKMSVTLVASLLSAGSTFAQSTISSFYFQDFENTESREMGAHEWDGTYGYWEIFGYDETEKSRARFADGIGNPGKAVEVNADLTEEDMWFWECFGPAVSGVTDPETLVQWDFDLWTSQNSPISVDAYFRNPRGGSWEVVYYETIKNDEANSWQTHSIVFSAFGLDPAKREGRATRIGGFEMFTMEWYIEGKDWGYDEENIMRLDNVKMSIIPEPSEYALMIGLGLLGFVAIRRRRIKIS